MNFLTLSLLYLDFLIRNTSILEEWKYQNSLFFNSIYHITWYFQFLILCPQINIIYYNTTTCFGGMIIRHKINSFIWWDQNREISSGKMIFLPLLYLLLKAWIIRRRRTMTNFWFITTVKHDVESRPWPSLYYSTSSAFAYTHIIVDRTRIICVGNVSQLLRDSTI